MVEQASFLGLATGTQRLQPIRVRGFSEPDRQEVETRTIAQVEANPERYLAAYEKLPQSFEGRYVAADLMKETIAEYGYSREHRGRYNAPVHNSAAVLAAAQFERRVADISKPEQNVALFLTGSPGAGKTSSVLVARALPEDIRVVWEGQLANPQTSLEKIGSALNGGLTPVIKVVHTRPEVALAGTLQRFDALGRGSSIALIADIMGGLPEGLRAIHKEFGNQVMLIVRDVRDRLNYEIHTGWDKLPLLETEGKRDDIYTRLEARLNALEQSGSISRDAAEQARGRAPFAELSYVARRDEQRDRGDGLERGSAQGSGKAAILAAAELRLSPRQVEPLSAEERFNILQGIQEVKLLRERAIDKLTRVVKLPKEFVDKIDAAMASARGDEVNAAQRILDLKQDMLGSSKLLDFAGKKTREDALLNAPSALESVTRYARAVQAEGQNLDREDDELRRRAAKEVPSLSPELKQLVSLSIDSNEFKNEVRIADKTALNADIDRVIKNIEERLGPEVVKNGGEDRKAQRMGLRV